MLIAHVTDSHIELPEPANAGRCGDFKTVVAHIKSLKTVPDLIIHTGDISHCDQPGEYRFARQMLDETGLPFDVIPGNKDTRTGMAKVFGTPQGFVQKTIGTKNWQLLLLDTLSDKSNKGAFCKERLIWLENELLASNKPVAIFMHHPSFFMTQNPYPFQFDDQKSADDFNSLVSGFNHIKAIFCGHAHRTTYETVGHISAMTLTAMSLDRRKGTYDKRYADKPIYQLIELKPDGTFETRLQACG